MNIYNNTYEELKDYYDTILNKENDFSSSNDEPTPIGCIEEILSKIPKEFWNGSVKILDPCSGKGNFHLVSWNILRNKGYSNDSIIRNNLYANDINCKRLLYIEKIFGNNSNLTINDYLNTNSGEKYDLIYANPPYAKIMKNGKRAAKNHTLVRDFLSRALKDLKQDGYLAFIIPDNWMSLADRNIVIKEITKYQFIYLNIHGAKTWFPKIGSSFTWFIIQKTNSHKKFQVDSYYKGTKYTSFVNSTERSFIPLLYTSEVQSILMKTIESNNKKYKIETTSDLHKYTKKNLISSNKTNIFKYKLIHTPKQIVWASRPHKYQSGYKVFISLTDKYSTFIDNCGMTQSIAFIRCKDKNEADKIKSNLDKKLYVFLNNICRWGNFNNIRILQTFPIPNTNDIYKEFKLTKEEIDFIEKIEK